MSKRLQNLDYLRLAAVFFVVVQHAQIFVHSADSPGTSFSFLYGLTAWNVPALFLVSGFLAGKQTLNGVAARGVRRLGRLLVPYVCWGTFYTVLFAGEAFAKGVPVRLPTVLDLFTGSGVYFILWFLPMLAYCALIGSLFSDRSLCLAGAAASFAGWFAVVAVFSKSVVPSYASSGVGFLYHLPFFVALYLLAKAMGMADLPRTESPSWMWPAIAAAPLLIASGLIWTANLTGRGTALTNALGMCAGAALGVTFLSLALRVPDAGAQLSPFWAGVAPYGIYLTHMLFLEAFNRVFPTVSLTWYVYVPVASVLAFLGAAAIVAALIRVRVLRPAFGLSMARGAQSAEAVLQEA